MTIANTGRAIAMSEHSAQIESLRFAYPQKSHEYISILGYDSRGSVPLDKQEQKLAEAYFERGKKDAFIIAANGHNSKYPADARLAAISERYGLAIMARDYGIRVKPDLAIGTEEQNFSAAGYKSSPESWGYSFDANDGGNVLLKEPADEDEQEDLILCASNYAANAMRQVQLACAALAMAARGEDHQRLAEMEDIGRRLTRLAKTISRSV